MGAAQGKDEEYIETMKHPDNAKSGAEWAEYRDAWDAKPKDRSGKATHDFGIHGKHMQHNKRGFGERSGTGRVHHYNAEDMAQMWRFLDEFDKMRIMDLRNDRLDHEPEYVALIKKYGQERVDALINGGKATAVAKFGKFSHTSKPVYGRPAPSHDPKELPGTHGSQHTQISLAHPSGQVPKHTDKTSRRPGMPGFTLSPNAGHHTNVSVRGT